MICHPQVLYVVMSCTDDGKAVDTHTYEMRGVVCLRVLVHASSRGWTTRLLKHQRVGLSSFWKDSTWLLTASSDLNLGEVYIIGFLKVCSLLYSGIRFKAI